MPPTRQLVFDTPSEVIRFSVGGRPQGAHYSWFRGEHTNFNPAADNLLEPDAVLDYVLKGWAPDRPLIGPETRITAFGSCFATNISDWLAKQRFSVLTREPGSRAYVVRFGEGMVNSFVIRQQFEWAFEGKTPDGELWHGYRAEAFGYDEDVRLATRAIFRKTDVFIITLGLSEVWYDEPTGGVFWRAVPKQYHDPRRHRFRVSTVEENKESLRAIYALVRRHRPDARIILTLSPIPLVATFRPQSCITANSASKAILRAAVDEVWRELAPQGLLHYWPSYEIALDLFGDRWQPDRRHVKRPIIDLVMTAFEHVWCHGSTPRFTILEAWVRALAATGVLAPALVAAVPRRNAVLVEQLRRAAEARGDARRAVLFTRLLAEWGSAGAAPGDSAI
jgi:hypothetical protein